MKIYQEIESVTMASTYEIESVNFHKMPKLKEISYEDGYIDPEDIYLTKDQVLEAATHIVVAGYGRHTGRKVWQLPKNIINQIKKTLKRKELS